MGSRKSIPLFDAYEVKYPGVSLHTIGPYLGKLRPAHARQLISQYTAKGDTIWDPFCGSGSVLLEAQLQLRQTIGGDVNPYASLLSRAKLHAPSSLITCLRKLGEARDAVRALREPDVSVVPDWVRDFFHEKTLVETIALNEHLEAARDYFLRGCLIGILHHQRPGYLSFPASNFAPYLRNRRFPRADFPEAYKYKDPFVLLEAKARRALRFPPPDQRSRFRLFQRSALHTYVRRSSVDAVISSPPYMKNLDYARDNRLRLWFLGVEDYRHVRQDEMSSGHRFLQEMGIVFQSVSRALRPGGVCIFVLGKIGTKDRERNLSEDLLNEIDEASFGLRLEDYVETTARRRAASSGARGEPRNETTLVLRKQ